MRRSRPGLRGRRELRPLKTATRGSTSPDGMVKSLRQLAVLCGRSHQAVAMWTRHDDWPVSRVPPWSQQDVAKILAFRDIVLRRDTAAEYRRQAAAASEGRGEFAHMSLHNRARTQVLIERALTLRQRREIEARRMVRREEVEEMVLREIHLVKNVLLSWPASCRDALAYQPAESVEQILREQVNDLLKQLADGIETTNKTDGPQPG